MKTQYSHTLLTVVTVIITIIGLGIAEIVIYNNGTTFDSSTKTCPSLSLSSNTSLIEKALDFEDSITILNLEKQIFDQWHWDYTDKTVRIQQNCPTLMHDVNSLINDDLYSRSSTSLLSLYSNTKIYDCHGQQLFSFKTGSVFDTIVNNLHIQSSFQLFDSMDNLIAFIGGTNFFVDNLQVKSAVDGQEIATLYRDTLTFSSWTWVLNVNNTYKNLWPAILSMAGYLAFSNNGNNNSSDMCNQFFWGVAYMFIAVACILGLFLICFIKIFLNDKCKSSKSSKSLDFSFKNFQRESNNLQSQSQSHNI